MSAVISSQLVLTQQPFNDNSGLICYQNIVTAGSVTATSELANSPITNVANPATAFGWEASSTADQTITVDSSGSQIDYIGIARHNLAQSGLEVRIRFDGVTVSPYSQVSENQAILFLINEASPDLVQIDFRGIDNAIKIAVLYVGLSLKLQRNIYVGHTPITYGRDRSVINGVSESGEFLGEVVLNQTNSTSVNLQNLTPEWYRAVLDPYFKQSPRLPCFWAWRPASYEAEVGYVWVEGNPRPTNQRSNGMMEISWNFRGLA